MSIVNKHRGAYTSSGLQIVLPTTIVSGEDVLLLRVSGPWPQQTTAATYAGQAMTEVIAENDGDSRITKLYELQNPPIGSADLIIDIQSANNTHVLSVDALTNSGARTDSGSAGGWLSSATVSLANAASTDIIVDVIGYDSSITVTPAADQSVELDGVAATATTNVSSSHKTTASTPSVSWTMSVGRRVALVAAAYPQSAATDTTPPTLSNPTLTVNSNAAVTFGATSSEDGTAHAVVRLASDPAATQQEIVDGTYANAAAVPADVIVTANTAYQFAQVTGLTGNTTYAVDQVATDAAGNISAINTQTFTTQSKALRLTIDGGANRTYDFDVFSTTVDGTASIIKQFNGVTVAADGTVTLGLDDTSVTSGSSLEGLGKDTTTGDPVPIQGTVTVA